MKPLSQKLQQLKEQELEQQHQQKAVREFGTVEELLRHDLARTPVPPELAARVRDSVARESAAKAGWWQRLFGGRS
jgi:hypothetical protein